MNTNFAVRFVNIPDAGTRTFTTREQAEAFGRKSGFEFAIDEVADCDRARFNDPCSVCDGAK